MEIEGFGSLIKTDEMEWFETPGGNSLKVLRVSEETGSCNYGRSIFRTILYSFI